MFKKWIKKWICKYESLDDKDKYNIDYLFGLLLKDGWEGTFKRWKHTALTDKFLIFLGFCYPVLVIILL